MERGFEDCTECHGSGEVRHAPEMDYDSIERWSADFPDAAVTAYTVEIVACPVCAERRKQMKAAEGRRPNWPEIKSPQDLADWLNRAMVEGLRFSVPAAEWRRLCKPYASPFAALIGRTPRDDLMSNLIGSGWGGWSVRFDEYHGGLIIERCPTGDKRTYADPDRRHLYKEINGDLVHWDHIRVAEAIGAVAQMIQATNISYDRPLGE